MKFGIYPTRAARESGAMPLRVRTGQLLSAAPGGYWVQPWPREPRDPKVAFLCHKTREGDYWAAESEQSYA
jgi:hypothetical protein